jgi:hypothetical protein
MTFFRAVATVLVGIAALGAPVAAQKGPVLADVLRAGTEYLAAYAPRISGVSLEEAYTMLDVSGGRVGGTWRLTSDVVLLNLAGKVIALRDPFAIDNNALRPREPRITALLIKPTAAAWEQAQAFCRWLTEKTGRTCALPTEAQWEYACRAGTATPLNCGDCNTDFGKYANLADARLNELCRRDSPRWIPAVMAVNDGSVVPDHGDKYLPNAWGLHDMHGNVAEWTRTEYRPYPYREDDGRNQKPETTNQKPETTNQKPETTNQKPQTTNQKPETLMVVRGGSFYDRPERARSAFRLSYPAWQRIFSVGFRVVCEAAPAPQAK